MKPLSFTIDGPADAPILVLCNSLGTTRDMWAPQLDQLIRYLRVVRIDHPGHGESPVWDGPVTIEEIGMATVDVLDRLDLGRISFCGLSLGGAVGQWLAAHAPERIERLILCSTSARFLSQEVYLQRAAIVRERGMIAISDPVLERWFTPHFRATQPAIVSEYRAMLESIAPEGYAACCEAVAGFDGSGDLASIVAPTLVIAGDEDPATTVEQARVLCAGIPGARLTVIPDAAHLVNVEQPAAVSAAILEHLREGQYG